MNNELIHIKFEHDEALNSKKEILSSEINCLRIMKYIKNYKTLRKKELQLKTTLRRNIGELQTKINNLCKIVPSIKVSKNLLPEEKIEEIKKRTDRKTEKPKDKIEIELEEIQKKLASLKI